MSESQNRRTGAVGVEASVSALNAVRLDENGSLESSYQLPLSDGRPMLEQLIEFVKELPAKFGEIEKVGIAVPGLISKETGRVAFSAHIPEHAEADLTEYIRTEGGMSAVIENDANAAAFGEFMVGAGRGSRNMFYATLGHGIGGAFIFNGEIWRGAAGFAGEFGYIAINSDGLRLEDVASTENIVRRTRNRFNRDSTSSLQRYGEESIHLKDIIRAAESGDDFAALMLKRTGDYVGTAVASVINLLNIETIVLGGVIMQTGSVVLDAVIDRARELSFAPSFRNARIAAGTLGANAAAIGVALISKGDAGER